MKYGVDKTTGYLRVDRPQRSSSLPPTWYGFIPRTYCGSRVGDLSTAVRKGDGDSPDICVLSERAINRAEVILHVRIVGGIHMVDHGEADDKIVAVLQNDAVWGKATDISDIPEILVERLRRYFAPYKPVPGKESEVSVESIYDCKHARGWLSRQPMRTTTRYMVTTPGNESASLRGGTHLNAITHGK